MAKLNIWSNPQVCPASDLSCFFQPLGNSCTPAEGESTAVGEDFSRDATKEWVGGLVKKNWPKGTGEGVDRFMDVARTIAFLMRPTDAIENLIEESKIELGWENDEYPVLGVHVRTGDSCNNDIKTNGRAQNDLMGRSCQGLDDYIPFIRNMTTMYGIKHIFLATDGGAEIHDATKKYPEFTWFFSPRVKNKAHKFIEVRDLKL